MVLVGNAKARTSRTYKELKKTSDVHSLKKTGVLLIVCLVASLCSAMLRPVQSADEYLSLSSVGNSMSPTINDGDTVTVRMSHNGSSVRTGYLDSSTPGDIVVYSAMEALAYIPDLETMWICHRAVQKYRINGTWYFRTKGDNNPETDPWTVPEHSLLGVVTQIDHEKTQQATTQSSSSIWATLQTPQATLITGLSVSLAIIALVEPRRRRLRMLRKANVYSCSSCHYFRPRTVYELKETNGKLGIRRKVDLARGLCARRNITIKSDPTNPTCKAYKPRTPTSILSTHSENVNKHREDGSEQ